MTNSDNTGEMCQVVLSGNVGYGPDVDVPCGAKAEFLVEYDLFIIYDAETGETDFWIKCHELACDEHRGQMVSYAEAHTEEMQITRVRPVGEESDNTDPEDKSFSWDRWYQNLPTRDYYHNL